MIFSGYIQLRRGLLSHIQDGRLTNNEALTFIVLLMLADSSTGSYTINAPTLRAFLPELSYDAAKRALLGLEEKRYIFRDIVPFSTRAYRYWINNYQATTGKHKALQTDISKALETRDVNDIRYINPALEGAPEGALETALEGAPHNKNKKEKKKETKPISPGVCTSVSDALCASSATQLRTAKRTLGEACAPHDAHQSALHSALHDMHHDVQQTMHQGMHHLVHHDTTHAHGAPQPVRPLSALRTPEELGMFWSEHDGAYREVGSGRLLSLAEFQDRFSQGATNDTNSAS